MERVGMIGLHPNPVRTGVHLSVHNARKPCPVLGILGKKKGNRSRESLICRPFVYLSRQPCSATPAPLREVGFNRSGESTTSIAGGQLKNLLGGGGARYRRCRLIDHIFESVDFLAHRGSPRSPDLGQVSPNHRPELAISEKPPLRR